MSEQEKRTMHKPLTTEQKEKVTYLYRERGWSIKKIAKGLHIGDKRVSAYLKGKMGSGKPCGCEPHKKPESTGKAAFLKTVKGLAKSYETACNSFATTVYKIILEEISDLFCSQKHTKKECEKRADARLERLFDAVMNVTYSAGCAALFTMPPGFKKIWLDNLSNDPSVAMKKKQTTKKAKK